MEDDVPGFMREGEADNLRGFFQAWNRHDVQFETKFNDPLNGDRDALGGVVASQKGLRIPAELVIGYVRNA